MMWIVKQIARIFSALAIGLILGGAAFLVWERYQPAQPAPPAAPLTAQIDQIVIEKSARTLSVFRAGKKVKTYKIALGFAPSGDKVQEGDGKTPEGMFTIDRRNPKSAFHLSLGIDYPRPADRARAKAQGVSPGGDIFIHGQPNGAGRLGAIPYDWTAGCVAVSDAEIRELWAITPIGTSVEIRP